MPTAPRVYRSKTSQRFKGTKQQRGYGGEWEHISNMIRSQHPVCQMCNAAPSEDVDHIIPFRGIKDPLRTDRNNLRAVCRACHSRKTKGQP